MKRPEARIPRLFEMIKKAVPLIAVFIAVAYLSLTALLFIPQPEPSWAEAGKRYYYVRPDGNDSNSGTIAKPFKTIQKAVDVALAGDTIYIRAGKYRERVVLKRSGRAGKLITIRNYPGEVPVIDGAGLKWAGSHTLWGGLIDTNEKSYFKLIGLTIQNSAAFGIGRQYRSNPKESSHIVVQDCKIYNTLASGISVIYGKDIVIDNNIVDYACNTVKSNQECLSLSEVDGFAITNNIVRNGTTPPSPKGKGGEMISVKDGCKNGIVAFNTVYNFQKLGIYLDAYRGRQENIAVYRNVVYQPKPGLATGIALGSEKGGVLKKIYLHNNVVYNTQWGFVIAGWGHSGYAHPITDIFILNNTCYNINTAGILLTNPDSRNITVKNNILHGRNSWTFPLYATDGADAARVKMSHNLIQKHYSKPSKEPYYITGTDYIVTSRPKFANPPADFRLQPVSPAIKAGRTLDGEVCNIGAY
ncbi:MAG: right-handed parallel beta-helix repeat-containing protein [Thermincola sp.]|jgi:hypothetical protein|nr:right-handed parallel beta-helix repeat-containing protein [Thermincola sp.]